MDANSSPDGQGLKWLLRLFAPLCLGLVLILAWQEQQMAVTAKLVLASSHGGEPPPGLTALFLLESFPWAACVFPAALIGYSVWSLERSSSKIGWGLTLVLAAFFAVAVFAAAHLALHRLPFISMMHMIGSTRSSFHPPPPEHECPVCGGWRSWSKK
ncbi:MAG: hypothetical protein RL095_4141 [Verrucomicrobiota bacterium]|jgi:sterol desaturase/sphingolipid hydroxylase (fatty acid hydroxylase superfamily)